MEENKNLSSDFKNMKIVNNNFATFEIEAEISYPPDKIYDFFITSNLNFKKFLKNLFR